MYEVLLASNISMNDECLAVNVIEVVSFVIVTFSLNDIDSVSIDASELIGIDVPYIL